MKERKTIAAVLGEDIFELLNSINKHEALLEGSLFCSKCKKQLDENNLSIIYPKTKSEFEFFCNNPGCCESFLKSEKNE